MDTKALRSLLDRVGGIHHACDLDLLLFFYRHPRALLTSEQLVTYLGYDRDRVAKSIEGLIEAALLTRSQNLAHAARLYRLEFGGPSGGWLESLLNVAATRQGRQAVMQLLNATSERISTARLRRRAALVRAA